MDLDIKKLKNVARKLHVDITDYEQLQQALTHRSCLGETEGVLSNERLEFLGDAVLGLVVCEYLFTQYTDRAEGELAKAKAVAVSEPILAEAAKALGLDQMLLMSSGEEMSGGRKRFSILSDAFEAIVAVVYLDCGLEAARQFVLRALESILVDIDRKEHIRDYKSLLQEMTQGAHKKAPRYVVISEEGADHDKTFVVEARLEGAILGKGAGKSKKQAEQAAALEALEKTQKVV
ncbi:MAG: ribonuclease III [Armatimonadota bacterium]|nr:ribonuclease III [Armatimonadota bacterium]